jgi:anti-anti-sigma factor
MEISHLVQDRALIITPLGEHLDARESSEFKEKIFELLDQTTPPRVIFDFKKLQFIDSSGLGCLLSILRKLNSRGTPLKLANLSEPVRSLFELVLMHKIFDIAPDLGAALKS